VEFWKNFQKKKNHINNEIEAHFGKMEENPEESRKMIREKFDLLNRLIKNIKREVAEHI